MKHSPQVCFKKRSSLDTSELCQCDIEHLYETALRWSVPIDPRSVNLYFAHALQRAGLPAVRLYDARHTYATWMLEQGVPPKVVQTILGHGSIAVTLDIYSHVSLDLERQEAAKLNAALTGA
jgi:integrase